MTTSAILRSIRAVLSALAAGELSCEELTQEMLRRCTEANRTLNCFITLQPELTLAQARASDARRRAGRAGPLEGLPIAHKDIFCAAGWPTTCGSHILKNFVSPYDAHLLARLNDDGALLLGKTNMDEFAMGSSNETSFFGPVRNPWNHALVPGGSSGGSAAAVAAGLTPAATGTDTGGSIRQPAAFCGITGLKPTYGLVSRFGMVAFASSLDQAGPLAHSAEDCALLLNSMAGFDPRDSTSVERTAEDYVAALNATNTADSSRPLQGQTVGLPQEFFPATLDAEIRRQVTAAIETLSAMGAEVVHLSLPRVDLSLPAYYVLAPAEASSNLSRFDGVRYGLRSSDSSLADLYTDSRSLGFGDEVKRRILIGTYVLSQGYYDAYYLQAQKIRRLIAQDFDNAFARCDLIASPTTPTTAFALGSRQADPLQMYLSDIFTIAAPLAGLPALSLPCGFDAAGLPIGLQFIGPAFSEARLLATAHHYQKATDWHLRAPLLS